MNTVFFDDGFMYSLIVPGEGPSAACHPSSTHISAYHTSNNNVLNGGAAVIWTVM